MANDMNRFTTHRGRRSRRAFTLIEIMVVVVVLGILATFIIRGIAGQDETARVNKARTDVAMLTSLIESFRLDMRRYPSEEEGLNVLREPPAGEDAARWKGPYSRSAIPNDPWGEPYRLLVPAPNGIDPFGIESYGADKAPGGETNAQDINSWTVYEEEQR
jgi:general secretion pathway protein G